MESTIDIRKKIHDFIELADERILKIFSAIISAEENAEEGLSSSHKKILDHRIQEHLKNPNEGTPWLEVKEKLQKQYGL